MPTPQQVSSTILTAQLKAANLTLSNVTALQGGALKVNWGPIVKAQRGINSVQNRYVAGDFTSATFMTAYACLTAFVGTYAGGTIDPNAQNPGTVINVAGNPLPPPQIAAIVAGVTPAPLTVTYSTAVYGSAKYALIRPDGTYDWNTEVQAFPGVFIITGQDDGSGKFLDSGTFYVLG